MKTETPSELCRIRKLLIDGIDIATLYDEINVDVSGVREYSSIAAWEAAGDANLNVDAQIGGADSMTLLVTGRSFSGSRQSVLKVTSRLRGWEERSATIPFTVIADETRAELGGVLASRQMKTGAPDWTEDVWTTDVNTDFLQLRVAANALGQAGVYAADASRALAQAFAGLNDARGVCDAEKES